MATITLYQLEHDLPQEERKTITHTFKSKEECLEFLKDEDRFEQFFQFWVSGMSEEEQERLQKEYGMEEDGELYLPDLCEQGWDTFWKFYDEEITKFPFAMWYEEEDENDEDYLKEKMEYNDDFAVCDNCEEYVNCLKHNIFCISKDDEDLTFCEDCERDCKESMKKQGYKCDDWDSDSDDEEEPTPCDKCPSKDILWCHSNGCEKGQRRLKYYIEEFTTPIEGLFSEDGQEQYCANEDCPYCSYIYEGWGGEYPLKGWVCDKCKNE